MQNMPLNPIDTALSFELKKFELALGCQSTAHTYNLLLCQKQRHEEKTTIQSCIILPRDKGKMALFGHCAAF